MGTTESKQEQGLAAIRELAFTHWQRSRLLLGIQGLLVVVPTLVAAVLVAAILCGWRGVARHRVVDQGSALSWSLAEAALPRLEAEDPVALQKLVRDAVERHDLLAMAVIDPSGSLLASAAAGRFDPTYASMTHPPVVSVEGGHFFTKSPDTGRDVVVFFRPIDSPTRTVGRLRVVMAAPGWLPFSPTSTRTTVAGFSAIGLLLCGGAYLAGVVLRPILNLSKQIGEPHKSAQWRRLRVDGGGEASNIAQSWNAMVAEFEQMRATMESSNRQLQLQSGVVLYEKRRADQVLDSLPDGLIVVDVAGNVVNCNRQAAGLLEVETDEVVGRPAAEALPALAEALNEEVNNRIGPRRGEIVLRRGETESVLQVVSGGLVDADGNEAGRLVAVRDVTQLKAEEAARNEFVATVTHELRAPLGNIQCYVEMLTDGEQDTPELRKEFFNVVSSESERLSALIDNLLSISRIEMGGYAVQKSPTKTRRLLEDAASSLESEAQGRHIDLQVNLPETLPDLDVDKNMIRVVLMNLLSNGLKYTGDGGTVVLSAEAAEGELRVHVADTGCGIPEEELPKLFTKFYRGSNAVQRATGSGLGLALSRQIARLHGGDLKIESRLGEGTRTTLILPRTQEEVLAGVEN